jgi:hypothetical protein
MSFMYEVYYDGPRDGGREERILLIAESHGGACTYWEDGAGTHGKTITLTLEFETAEAATQAMTETTSAGYYAEGPYSYG